VEEYVANSRGARVSRIEEADPFIIYQVRAGCRQRKGTRAHATYQNPEGACVNRSAQAKLINGPASTLSCVDTALLPGGSLARTLAADAPRALFDLTLGLRSQCRR
jgi:hypothetical protein